MTEAIRRSRPYGLWAGVVLASLAVFLVSACRSLPKPELQERLAELGKNAAMGELQRTRLQVDLGEGPQEFELVYYRALASEPVDPTPAVLIHGTPSTLYSWAELIHGAPAAAGREGFEGLAAERDVYAIEVVGHGVAPGELPTYSFERCARFVGAALSTLGLERVHLVGSSYGGEFAWRAARNDPARFVSLTLIDSSGFERREGDWLPEEVEMRENGLAKIGWILNSRDRIETALAPHFREVPPDRVEEFFLVCENSDNWAAMVDLARDENGERQDELSTLEVPTLVLWGSDDIAYPLDVYGRRFAEEIPTAELVALPECGHYPHEERPAEVVRTLERFFEARTP